MVSVQHFINEALYVFIRFIQMTNYEKLFSKHCANNSNVFNIVNTTNQYFKTSEESNCSSFYWLLHKSQTFMYHLFKHNKLNISIGPKLITTPYSLRNYHNWF